MAELSLQQSLAESDQLHARVRALIDAFATDATPPEHFDTLARDLAAFQARVSPLHARMVASRTSSESPAIPVEVWKHGRVAWHPASHDCALFRTSGTTEGPSARGSHAFRTLDTYAAGALAMARRHLVDAMPRFDVLVLGPTKRELADSSLTYMTDLFVASLGADRTLQASGEQAFFVEDGIIDLVRLSERIAHNCVNNTPVLLLGTSFAFVHLLEGLADHDQIALPPGSRLMQTGGFKGRSREVPRAELNAALARVFDLPTSAIRSEYGMTELSSQFYTQDAKGEGGEPIYVEPPWARVVPVDPVTLDAVPLGEVGLARIEDLANVDSAWAILTQDRVRRVAGGFQLLGRAPQAELRGCSLTAEEWN
jgi:hypothetical protein